jgi:hypothetical protein
MAVDPLSGNAAPQIAGAIRQAAQSTGVSFQYLLTTAQIESNLNPGAQASTSSAKGLYQFIDQTWLGTMKQDGPALGLSRYADAISKGADGRFEVADPSMRTAIMRLRSDPTTSATLAGAFTRNNAAHLSSAIGRQPSEGELYIAHFLGPDGAGKLIGAAASHPRASAAAMFPQAAAANPGIFYDRSGSARSASAVYANLTGRFDNARNVAFAPGLRGTVAPGLAQASAPDTAGITQAFATATDTLPPMPDTKPLFQAMFTDRVRTALAPTVNSLWGAPKSGATRTSASSSAGASVQALDLFTDGRGDIRKLFGNS